MEAEKMMVVKKKVFGGQGEMDDGDHESVGLSPRYHVVPAAGRNNINNRWSSNYTRNQSGVAVGKFYYLHSQILRIRDEDSHIGEDFNAQVLNFFVANKQELASLMLLSGQFLPASPLGEKPPIRAADIPVTEE
ncbi:hypothetical protein ACH5RR_011164 [Cinchona calisaya]|uniref:Uncharacterized protein n=1 Tax=Cinchona calisaya TaxID=153742 RepID=A0ABD3A5M5_9GENT